MHYIAQYEPLYLFFGTKKNDYKNEKKYKLPVLVRSSVQTQFSSS